MWSCTTVQQLPINFINLCQTKNIDIELNPDTFMFGEIQNQRKYQTEQCHIYANNKLSNIYGHIQKQML